MAERYQRKGVMHRRCIASGDSFSLVCVAISILAVVDEDTLGEAVSAAFARHPAAQRDLEHLT